MNLVWHIVKKDFTRLRLPLALWTGLLLSSLGIFERMFSTNSLDQDWVNHQTGILGVITFVWMVVGYILVAAVGLEDPLVGSQIFWVTRPISGGRLLAAKLLGATVFFLLGPVVVTVPWLLWCGFGLRDIGDAALQLMVIQAPMVLLALAIAALAGQSSRFLLWTLVTMLVVPMGTGMVAYYLPKDLPRELSESRVILAYGVGLVACGVVIWLQYRTRRLARTMVVTVAAAALALLVGFFWPWNVTGLWPKDTSQRLGTESISLTFGETTFQTKDGKCWVTLMLTAKDIPPELGILSGEAHVEFRWPDGTTLQRLGKIGPVNPDYTARSLLNLPPAQVDGATEMKKKEMEEANRRRMLERGLPPKASLPEGLSLITSMEIPSELAGKFAAPPAVRVALRLQTGQAELLAEVPLKAGARQTGNGLRLQLLKVEPVGDQPATQVTATVVSAQPMEMKFVQFLLVDRVHGTVIMEGAAQIPSFRGTVLPIAVARSMLRLNIPQLWRDGQWVGMPEWLEKDTLAAVTYRPDGGFDRELQADRLEFLKK